MIRGRLRRRLGRTLLTWWAARWLPPLMLGLVDPALLLLVAALCLILLLLSRTRH